MMSGGLAAVLLAVSEAPVWGWLSARTLGVLAVGLALLAAWVRSEARSPSPLVDMHLMRIRGVLSEIVKATEVVSTIAD